jgi:hypothetical protein
MARVTFIIGLCGSGKTHLAEKLQEETGAELFDDFVERLTTDLPILLRYLKEGRDCIVQEIGFCFAEEREVIDRALRHQLPGVGIEWICFENDLESANWNVCHRTNKGKPELHLEINERVHRQYTYPHGCTPLRIHRIAARS